MEKFIVTLIFDDGEKQVRKYKSREKAMKCYNDYRYLVESCISVHIRIENEEI